LWDRLHGQFNERMPSKEHDMGGGYIRESSVDEKIADAELEPTAEGEEPNEHEKLHLRRVGERLPMSAFLIAIVELCERFTYYGCQGLFQNYISNSPSGKDGARGLGFGHQGATGLNVFFQFFCYGKLLWLREISVHLLIGVSHSNFGSYHCRPVPW
jgi:proton-dependent oligopeptide transporter, POT family